MRAAREYRDAGVDELYVAAIGPHYRELIDLHRKEVIPALASAYATPPSGWADNFADFHTAIHDPATVAAMLEDYRAGLGVDRAHDDADRAAGRTVRCPTLILWARDDDLEGLYGDPLDVWRQWARDLRGGVINSGHQMAEEQPDELALRLTEFLDTLDGPAAAGH